MFWNIWRRKFSQLQVKFILNSKRRYLHQPATNLSYANTDTYALHIRERLRYSELWMWARSAKKPTEPVREMWSAASVINCVMVTVISWRDQYFHRHTRSKGRAIQNDTIEIMITALALSRDYRDWTVNSVDVQCVCHTGESRSRDLSEGDVILLTELEKTLSAKTENI